MATHPPVPKSTRLTEFFRRLAGSVAQADQQSARRLLDETLNQVEDELSGVPFTPDAWRTDGRMYPVQDDNAADVPDFPGVVSLRSRAHETFIASNGAIEIRNVTTDAVIFAKVGADGKGVWQ